MLTDKQLADWYKSLSPAKRNQLMKDLAESKAKEDADDERKKYQSEDGIVAFVREKLGADPADYQERILRALVKYKRVTVRGPHGLGKSCVASWVVLWGMYAFPDDVKIPTTASVWRQLEKFLWPEIRKWTRNLTDKDFRVLQLALKGDNKEAFALASDEPSALEGVHAKTVIAVVDEAKSVLGDTFDAIEGYFSGAGDDTEQNAYALVISTPGSPSGRFYDICTKKPGLQDWHTIHVTLEDAIKAGRISRQWAEKRAEQWGIDSAVYKNRVLGEFDQSGEDNIIPLAWIEAAHERYYQLIAEQKDTPQLEAWGLDPARYGSDKTALCRKRGRVIHKLNYYTKQDTMQTVGRVTSQIGKDIPIAVDVIGIGAGCVDRLKELEYNVTGVNVAEAARTPNGKPLKDITDTFEFVNLRSWLWWHMRDCLNPMNPDAIGLSPDDDLLTGDLCAPKYTYTSDGKIKVESKDDIRKRLKRSTDGGDAVALALYMTYLATAKNGWTHTYRKLYGRVGDVLGSRSGWQRQADGRTTYHEKRRSSALGNKHFPRG